MRTSPVEFFSDGTRLDGLLQFPDAMSTTGRLPAVIICSGFQGLKELIPAKLWGPLVEAGYACFAFDYRGFGTSDGVRGRVIPQEQVEDIRNAVTIVQQQSEIDPERIALLGWGLGGALVIQAAADDVRVRAVACLNGVGDVGRASRGARPYSEWLALRDRVAVDRVQRVLTGHSEVVSPWEIVVLDAMTRASVDADMYGNHARFGLESTLQSADACFGFRPELVVDRISPRPLLLIHGTRNELYPIDEARSLYCRAGDPKTIFEVPDGHHLDWIQPGHPQYGPMTTLVVHWLDLHLPRAISRTREMAHQ